MIFILFIIAFLGLWAVINFLLKSFQTGEWAWPKFSLPKMGSVQKLSLPKISLPNFSLPNFQWPISPEVKDKTKTTNKTTTGVEITQLVKEYPSGSEKIRAVDIPTLDIRAGEFLAVMGRSGSGKSSLLNLLGGLDKPTSGVIYLDGDDLSTLKSGPLSKLRNQKIGFIFQESNLIPSLTALENVELPLKYARIPGKEKKERALKALENVGLKKRVNHFPSQLSGGEAQRVTIARALVNNPSLVLADEPTGEVDSQTSGEIIDLMKDLNKKFGTTFVIVTHDPLVAHATNRIIRLQDGKVLSDKRIIKIDGSVPAGLDLV